jgi:hypothetical protein
MTAVVYAFIPLNSRGDELQVGVRECSGGRRLITMLQLFRMDHRGDPCQTRPVAFWLGPT